jgi:hypothetical protein
MIDSIMSWLLEHPIITAACITAIASIITHIITILSARKKEPYKSKHVNESSPIKPQTHNADPIKPSSIILHIHHHYPPANEKPDKEEEKSDAR